MIKFEPKEDEVLTDLVKDLKVFKENNNNSDDE